jgi:hypothetical protein
MRSDPTKPPESGRADGSTRRLGDPGFATLPNQSRRLGAQDEREKKQGRNGMDPAAQGGAARRTLHARTRYGRQQLRLPWERRREGAAVNDRRRSRARGREGKGRGLEGGLFIKCRVVFSRRGLVRSVRDLAHSFFILFLLLLFPCLGWVVDLIYWLFFIFCLRGGLISRGFMTGTSRQSCTRNAKL